MAEIRVSSWICKDSLPISGFFPYLGCIFLIFVPICLSRIVRDSGVARIEKAVRPLTPAAESQWVSLRSAIYPFLSFFNDIFMTNFL